MEKKYFKWKLEKAITLNDLINAMFSFIKENNGIKPTVVIVSQYNFNHVVEIFSHIYSQMNLPKVHEHGLFEVITVEGITMRLIASTNVEDFYFEIH